MSVTGHYSASIATSLGLPELEGHAGTVIASFAFFTLVHVAVAPLLSAKLFPRAFNALSKKAQNQWSNRVTALSHAMLVVPLAARCIQLPSLDQDRAFGWDARAGQLIAVASGYFLWDSLESSIHFVDPGFVAHALACLLIYLLQFRPFLAYYGIRCLLWEISTPFLNIHWFLDKAGRTGSFVQFVNGLLLLGTFAGARLLWGSLVSFRFFQTLYQVRNQVPVGYVVVYGMGNIILNLLNWYWFAKMISALKRRFRASPHVVAKGD